MDKPWDYLLEAEDALSRARRAYEQDGTLSSLHRLHALQVRAGQTLNPPYADSVPALLYDDVVRYLRGIVRISASVSLEGIYKDLHLSITTDTRYQRQRVGWGIPHVGFVGPFIRCDDKREDKSGRGRLLYKSLAHNISGRTATGEHPRVVTSTWHIRGGEVTDYHLESAFSGLDKELYSGKALLDAFVKQWNSFRDANGDI